MPYTSEELQRIVQWINQRVPRLMEHGCPLLLVQARVGIHLVI